MDTGKRNHRLLTSALLLFAGLGATLAGAQSGTAANPDLMQEIDSSIRDMAEIAADPAPGQEDVNLVVHPEEEGPWGVHQAAGDHNPLITGECREGAMMRAVESIMDHDDVGRDEAEAMRDRHLSERQGGFPKTGMPYSEYIEHIASCRKVCNVVVRQILACHVLAVRHLEHDVVTFDLDSDTVEGRRNLEAIGRILATLRADAEKNVLLIGRASHIGNMGYNRRLSGRRAASVGEYMKKDLATSRVRILFFGWEPPQIGPEIAQAYDLSDLYHRLGEHGINQSVMMVVY